MHVWKYATQVCMYALRVEKSGEHGENAPRTHKAFSRNTWDKNSSKRCLNYGSFWPIRPFKMAPFMIFTLKCSIVLCHLTIHKHWDCSAIVKNVLSRKKKIQEQSHHQFLLLERHSAFFSPDSHIQVCKYISMNVCKNESMRVYEYIHIWVISPSHSKKLLVLVKIAILQALSFFILE